MSNRLWAPAVAGVFGLLLAGTRSDAAQPHPAPLLTAAEADDVGDRSEYVAKIAYLARVAAHTPIDEALKNLAASTQHLPQSPPPPFHVSVSGEDLSALIRWTKPSHVPVHHLVLIDIGPPRPGTVPKFPAYFATAVQKLAHAHAQPTKDAAWTFRFIAGDERLCRLSGDIAAATLASDPQAALNAAAGKLEKTDLPFLEEKMLDMVRLFGGRGLSHTLVIVSEAPPVWLPRETTEWMTRGEGLSRADRKALGLLMQSQVRAGDAAAMAKLADWVMGGHLLPVVLGPPNVASAASTDNLRIGVEEALARAPVPAIADLNASGQTVVNEYSGTVDIPLTHVQRPSSGGYDVQLAIGAGDEQVITRAIPVVERAQRSWLPRQLQTYRFVVLVSAVLLLAILLATHILHWVADLDEEIAQESRNATFVFAGLAFGLAASLVGEGYLQYAVSWEAVVVGVGLTFLGIAFWLSLHALRVVKRELALLNM